MLLFGPKNDVISKKKRSSPKFKRFFRSKLGDLQKKKGLQTSHAGLSGSFQWSPSRAHGPTEANNLYAPKVHGPFVLVRGHCLPLLPLSAALYGCFWNRYSEMPIPNVDGLEWVFAWFLLWF